MLRCDGIPEGPCPLNSTGSIVNMMQGDMNLCQHCYDVRYNKPQTRNKTSAKSDDTCPKQRYSASAVDEEENIDANQLNDIDNSVTICDPLLSYIVYSMMNSTSDNIKNAVLGHFTDAQINNSKFMLWNKCDMGIIGEKPRRKDSSMRPEKEAHVLDILNALSKLDKAGCMPNIVINAMHLGHIPRSFPEELNNISLADRLNRFETKLTHLQEVLDRTVCENITIKERLDKSESAKPTYAAAVTKPTIHVPDSNDGKVQSNSIQSENVENNRNYLYHDNKRGRGRGNPRGRGANRFSNMNNLRVPGDNMRSSSCESIDRFSTASATSKPSVWSRHTDFHDDGFELPSYAKRQMNRLETRRKKFITGISTSKPGSFKGAPEPNRDLFIFRVDKETTESQITNHVKDHGFFVRNLSCVSNPSAKFRSFRLTVPLSQFDDLFNESIWPAGVRVRKYIPPKLDMSRNDNA